MMGIKICSVSSGASRFDLLAKHRSGVLVPTQSDDHRTAPLGREGLGFDSRLAVAHLGLATASRSGLLTEYRSGVLIPT